LLHDRDAAFAGVAGTIKAMQIQEVVTAVVRSIGRLACLFDRLGEPAQPFFDRLHSWLCRL
jgi:hypothetical protein